jgi:hypothetical protein
MDRFLMWTARRREWQLAAQDRSDARVATTAARGVMIECRCAHHENGRNGVEPSNDRRTYGRRVGQAVTPHFGKGLKQRWTRSARLKLESDKERSAMDAARSGATAEYVRAATRLARDR